MLELRESGTKGRRFGIHRATAVALAGLMATGGPAAAAGAPKAAAAKVIVAPVATADDAQVLIVADGQVTGQKTAAEARKDGLTVVDLSDEWLPFVFSETPEKPQPLRPFLVDLANNRMRPAKN
ncbi:MAG TPA: hypothetical protein VHU40_09475, partial [Polyangia bacterium]|nr:hypothetical protein [Polyangia bacterium]